MGTARAQEIRFAAMILHTGVVEDRLIALDLVEQLPALSKPVHDTNLLERRLPREVVATASAAT